MADENNPIPPPAHATNPALRNRLNDLAPIVAGHGVDALSVCNKRLKMIAKTEFTRTTSADVVEEEVYKYKHKVMTRHVNEGNQDDIQAKNQGGGVTLAQVNAAIANACNPGGPISKTFSSAIDNACNPAGPISKAIDNALSREMRSMKLFIKNDRVRLNNRLATRVTTMPAAEVGPEAGNAPSLDLVNEHFRALADIMSIPADSLNSIHDFYQEPMLARSHGLASRRATLREFLFGIALSIPTIRFVSATHNMLQKRKDFKYYGATRAVISRYAMLQEGE